MAALNPSPEDVAAKVPELREKFQEKFADNISKGVYDEQDVKRFQSDDAYARCFLRTLLSKGDVTKALATVDECFKFRKDQKIWDLTDQSFPAEILEKNAVYYKGADVNGFPIMYFNVKDNTASGDQVPILKQYIAYNFEKHHRENPEQMCVVILDMSGASTSNVSIDITKFIIHCFTHYFPAFLAYMINYEMPMLLSATWKIISAFLNSEQKQKLISVKKKEITKYIPAEHLWDHMK